jgi:pimeloyl-ACP methyl ester carboxylesterase
VRTFIHVEMKNFNYILIILLSAATALTSCLGRYTLTDKEINKYYKSKVKRPELKYMKYKEFHINTAAAGDTGKPLLLFIHGAPGTWFSYRQMLDDSALQKNFRMIAVDRVGFGKSHSGYSIASIKKHIPYLEKIIKENNNTGQKIYVMGSSYGGPIAAALAMYNPDLVEELYLISPVINPAAEKIFWFSYLGKLGFINWYIPPSLKVATDEKFAHRAQLRKLKPYWRNITAKTYVIMGEDDWIANPKANLAFAQKQLVNARGAEFILLEKTGHTIVWQRPELIKNILLKKQSTTLSILNK